MNTQECDRCGTCCRRGGPALHLQDRDLVKSGFLNLDDMITIRKGELAHHPLADNLGAVRQEFLKINGQGENWFCSFFDQLSASCTIYSNRPIACRLFKCWDTKDVIKILERDLLNRFDFITNDSSILPLVQLHARQCPCPNMVDIASHLRSSLFRSDTLKQLNKQVRLDIALRTEAVYRHNLAVSQELFYFGRPLFHLLASLGVTALEASGGLTLQYNS